jgi:hypothetical protein
MAIPQQENLLNSVLQPGTNSKQDSQLLPKVTIMSPVKLAVLDSTVKTVYVGG